MRRTMTAVLAATAVLAGASALPAGAAAPTIVPSAKFVFYGHSEVGATTLRRITFTNHSGSSMLFGPVAISTQGPAGFALAGDTCGAEIVRLAPAASCTYTVVFSPASSGAFRARLNYSAGSALAAVELRGGAG